MAGIQGVVAPLLDQPFLLQNMGQHQQWQYTHRQLPNKTTFGNRQVNRVEYIIANCPVLGQSSSTLRNNSNDKALLSTSGQLSNNY